MLIEGKHTLNQENFDNGLTQLKETAKRLWDMLKGEIKEEDLDKYEIILAFVFRVMGDIKSLEHYIEKIKNWLEEEEFGEVKERIREFWLVYENGEIEKITNKTGQTGQTE